MKYRVILSLDALEDARKLLRYIAEERGMPQTAHEWWLKAVDAINTLEGMPHRCGYAEENATSNLEIRALRVDNCLFLFRIDETNRIVRVLRIRHGSQLPFELR